MRAQVELFVDFDAVARDAGGALDRAAQDAPYDTIDWLTLTRDHVLPGARLLVARARLGNNTGWLPLIETGGRHGEPLSRWYTLQFAPIFGGRPDGAGKHELLTAIARALRGRLATLTLTNLSGEEAGRLARAFRTAGWLTRTADHGANWVARVAGEDFETYWARRPGQLRSTVRRKAAKAELSIEILDAFDAEAWADYEAVFTSSWKGAEGSPSFLRAFAERSSAWGSLRLGIARAAKRPIAAQLWTVDGHDPATRIATIHKLAYEEGARAQSPGTLLSHAMFESVITHDRPARISFGTGDDGYKAQWMDERLSLQQFEAFAPLSARGALAFASAKARALARRWRSA